MGQRLKDIEALMELMGRHGCLRVRLEPSGGLEIVRDPRVPSPPALGDPRVPSPVEALSQALMAMSEKKYDSPHKDPDLWDGHPAPEVDDWSEDAPDSETGPMTE